ncbi:MAG TPA: hypothetical protein PLW93_01925 [Candidatus Absconditabacterales bacterium]|nr:hypothetical protein [Candidatus Absconditabacterales bacterium]HNG97008.1 hypothetical protein [Candidatus Absconditabacterales bacterium]
MSKSLSSLVGGLALLVTTTDCSDSSGSKKQPVINEVQSLLNYYHVLDQNSSLESFQLFRNLEGTKYIGVNYSDDGITQVGSITHLMKLDGSWKMKKDKISSDNELDINTNEQDYNMFQFQTQSLMHIMLNLNEKKLIRVNTKDIDGELDVIKKEIDNQAQHKI